MSRLQENILTIPENILYFYRKWGIKRIAKYNELGCSANNSRRKNMLPTSSSIHLSPQFWLVKHIFRTAASRTHNYEYSCLLTGKNTSPFQDDFGTVLMKHSTRKWLPKFKAGCRLDKPSWSKPAKIFCLGAHGICYACKVINAEGLGYCKIEASLHSTSFRMQMNNGILF